MSADRSRVTALPTRVRGLDPFQGIELLILHSLTALNVQLQSANRLRASRPAEADTLIDSALDLGQRALASVRSTVNALRVDPLEREPLDRVLQRIVARHDASDSPRIDASVEAWREAPATATVVARIAEEALVNAIKHAGARRVRVALRASQGGQAARN